MKRINKVHPHQNESGKIHSDAKNFHRADLGEGTEIRHEEPGSERQNTRASMSAHFIPYRTVEEVGMKQKGRGGADTGRAGKNVRGSDPTQVKRPVRYQHG